MNKRIKKIFAVFAAIAIMVTCFGTVACSSGSDGTGITVNYNLNYDNMQRTITVRQGTILADWKPYREGYEVEGWYTDAQCTKPYDFNRRRQKRYNALCKVAGRTGILRSNIRL